MAEFFSNTDGFQQSRVAKAPCRLATTADIASFIGGAPNTVDGVAVAAGNRILVKEQATASQNGIYVVSIVGTGSDGTWVRAADFSDAASDDIQAGVTTYIQEGSTLDQKTYTLTTTGAITLGSTNLTFAELGGGGGGGGEDLAATLVLGNTTGGTNLIVSAGDHVSTEDATSGTQFAGGQIRFEIGGVLGDPTAVAATAQLSVDAVPLGSGVIVLTIPGLTSTTHVLTAVAGARTPGSNDFSNVSPAADSVSNQAQEIVDAINDPANAWAPFVSAAAVGGVITLTAVTSGVVANRYGISEGITNLSRLSFFSGGWDGARPATATIIVSASPVSPAGGTITIQGVVLTGVSGARTPGADDFQIDAGSEQLIAESIRDAINDPANSFTGLVTATSEVTGGNWKVTVIAATPGFVGNSYTLSDNMTGVSSGGGFGYGWEPRGSLLLDLGGFGSISSLPGGENRGDGAIDLQAYRAADYHVAKGRGAAIIGGFSNRVDNTGVAYDSYGTDWAAIVGGRYNQIAPRGGEGSYGAFIGAGSSNRIGYNAYGSAIFGQFNTIDAVSNYFCSNAFIAGISNEIKSGAGASGGSYHSVAMGRLNDIYGAQDSFTFGRFNYVGGPSPNYGSCSLAGGNSNTVRSYHTFVWGRSHSTHSRALQSGALGGACYLYVPGQFSHSGSTSSNGLAQASSYVLFRSTTSASTLELSTNSSAPGTSNRLFIRPNHTYAFRIEIAARQTAGAAGTVGDSAMWTIVGMIKRDGANNTVLVGVTGTGTPLISDAAAATWSVAVTADDTNESLKIDVTGQASKTIRWVAHVYDAES